MSETVLVIAIVATAMVTLGVVAMAIVHDHRLVASYKANGQGAELNVETEPKPRHATTSLRVGEKRTRGKGS
jgi:hypothetical protein